MKKLSLTLMFFIGLLLTVFAQTKNSDKEYIYTHRHYYEHIILRANGQFEWSMTSEFIKLVVPGNWQIRGDSLVLDSRPQRDKIIVWESTKKKRAEMKFFVKNKEEQLMRYTFYAITTKNDTLVKTDQWNQTTVYEPIKAFYIADTKGLTSPKYFIKGNRANEFLVFFETKRVFENECWLINGDVLIPKGMDGTKQKYALTKKR